MEHQWNEIDRGKPTTRRKTCPSATLSTTNLTWTYLGSNPGLRGERPATNRLSHGTASIQYFPLTIEETYNSVGSRPQGRFCYCLCTDYLTMLLRSSVGRYSVFGIATRYELDRPGIESRWERDFQHPSRPALGPTQSLVQWVPGHSRG
jgi:hypothetical protein